MSAETAAPTAAPPAARRFVTPSMLAFALLLFFLPWVEISCVNKEGQRMSFVTQSGLQAATGGYSLAGAMAEAEKRAEAQGGAVGQKDEGPDPAPLMWLYLAALLAGTAAGFALPPGKQRLTTLGACTGVALGVLLAQTAVGLPATEGIEEFNALKAGPAQEPPPGEVPPAPGPGDMRMEASYQPAFYLTWAALLGALGFLFYEARSAAPRPYGAGVPDDGPNPFDDEPFGDEPREQA